MARDPREKQGIVHKLKEQQEREAAAPATNEGTELPLELVVHSSNVAIGKTEDGMVHFMMFTPVGIKITVPSPVMSGSRCASRALLPM